MRKVFISYHFSQHDKLAKEIDKILSKNTSYAHLIEIDMLSWGEGSSKNPLSNSLNHVDQADILIVLLGDKLGSKPKGHDKTYIELEIEEAKAKNIPILAFAVGYNSRGDVPDATLEVLELCDVTEVYLEPHETCKSHAYTVINTLIKELDESKNEALKFYQVPDITLSVSGITKEGYDFITEKYNNNQQGLAYDRALRFIFSSSTNDPKQIIKELATIIPQLHKIFSNAVSVVGTDDKTQMEKIRAIKSLEKGNLDDAIKHLQNSYEGFKGDFFTCFWLARVLLYNDYATQADINEALEVLKKIAADVDKDSSFIESLYYTFHAVAYMKQNKPFEEVNEQFKRAMNAKPLKEINFFLCQFYFNCLLNNTHAGEYDKTAIKSKLISSLKILLKRDAYYYRATCDHLLKHEHANGYDFTCIKNAQNLEAKELFNDIVNCIDNEVLSESKAFNNLIIETKEKFEEKYPIEKSMDSSFNSFNAYNLDRFSTLATQSTVYFDELKHYLSEIVHSYKVIQHDSTLIENWENTNNSLVNLAEEILPSQSRYLRNFILLSSILICYAIAFVYYNLPSTDIAAVAQLQTTDWIYGDQALKIATIKSFFFIPGALVVLLCLAPFFYMLTKGRKRLANTLGHIKNSIALNNIKLDYFNEKCPNLAQNKYEAVRKDDKHFNKQNIASYKNALQDLSKDLYAAIDEKTDALTKDLQIWGKLSNDFENDSLSIFDNQLHILTCYYNKLNITKINENSPKPISFAINRTSDSKSIFVMDNASKSSSAKTRISKVKKLNKKHLFQNFHKLGLAADPDTTTNPEIDNIYNSLCAWLEPEDFDAFIQLSSQIKLESEEKTA